MFKLRANWLNSPKASNASWAWRSSENGKDILKQGACKLVDSRESILVWEDPWLPDMLSFMPIPKDLTRSSCLMVWQLVNYSGQRLLSTHL